MKDGTKRRKTSCRLKNSNIPKLGVIYGEEKALVAGVAYDEEGTLISGVTYDMEGTLISGVTYDMEIPEAEEICNTERERIQKEEEVMPKAFLEEPMLSVHFNNEERTAEKTEETYTVSELPKGVVAVPSSFDTQPVRLGDSTSQAFAGGNFALELIRIDHYVSEDMEGEVTEEYYIFQIFAEGEIFTAQVGYMDIENPDWVKKFSKGRAFLFPEKESKREFTYYVHAVIKKDRVPEKWLYKSTGWKKLRDGRFYYVDADGAVGHPEIPVCCKEDLHIRRQEWLTAQEDYIREAVGMTSICHDKKVSTMLFLYCHIGMMTTLFQKAEFPIQFVMGCIGVSNSKKTSLAALMCQLFNRESIKAEVSFMSTEGGLEMAISKYGDAVLLIDDFMPGANRQKQNQLQNKLEAVLRAYGDRVAKRRMTAFARTKENVLFPVRGCCLITGEQIAGAFSSMSRIVVLTQSAKDVDIEKLSCYQGKPHVLSLYAYAFLGYLTEHFEQVVEYIGRRGSEIRNKQCFKVPRLAETFAVFAVAADIVIGFLVSTQKFSETELALIKERFKIMIVSVMRENEKRLVEQDISVIILDALEEELGKKNNCVDKFTYQGNQDVIIYDDRFIYIKLERLYMCVKQYVCKYDCPIALNDKRQLVTYLKEAGILVSKKLPNGRTENARKIIGLPQNHGRYLHLDKIKIRKIRQGDKE